MDGSDHSGDNWPALTVAIINYNGLEVLPDTLDALRRVDYPNLQTMLVDDQSTDFGVAFVRHQYPEVRILVVPQSKHKPSVSRNLALREATTPYVMVIDNDVALRPDCLKRLMAVMLERPNTFRVTPRLVYHDQPDTIYMDAGGLSYLGISARSLRGRRIDEVPAQGLVPSIGSGIKLLHREAALQFGGWDEGYMFGWGEDAELVVRARMLGFDAWTVRDAVGLHVEKEHSTQRAEAQIYNRYRLMLVNYSMRALLLLAPALAMFDIMMMGMGTMKGLLPRHLHAIREVWRDRDDICRHRRFMQARRAVGDASLLEGTPILIPGVLKQSPFVRSIASSLSGLFIGYWRLVKRLLGDEPYAGRPRGMSALLSSQNHDSPSNGGFATAVGGA